MEKEHLAVGFIRAAHGFSGKCKIESASGSYEHLLKLKEVILHHNGEKRPCKVDCMEAGNNILYAKFEGIDSAEEIRKYNGWELLVPRKNAKPLQKGEWYIEDLIQCNIEWIPATLDAPSEIVGKITDVLEGGAGYLLEVSLSESCNCIDDKIKFTESGKNRKVLVPFNDKYIGKVDIKNQLVQLMHLWILE
ncbi:MAG: 16S rRNA processing protein RimM [Treponema sp.]|jgi:16S rRNA processing protein RimM|nr:16S rRNA processing protein RimM [Treponema sp.]